MCNSEGPDLLSLMSQLSQLNQSFSQVDLTPQQSRPFASLSNEEVPTKASCAVGCGVYLLDDCLHPRPLHSRSFGFHAPTDSFCALGGATIERLTRKQRWLVFMRHCAQCEGECHIRDQCDFGKRLRQHCNTCVNSECSFPHCVGSRRLIAHHQTCTDSRCLVCVPVREYFAWDKLMRVGKQGGGDDDGSTATSTEWARAPPSPCWSSTVMIDAAKDNGLLV